MKPVLKTLLLVGLTVGLVWFASAANMTMGGKISDSGCGASHAKMMQEHKDAKMSEKDCTLACVKAGGKFVFVSGGKVYNISNQNFAALTQSAGDTVTLTGNFDADNVTVSKIAAGK
jgi:hypothetical protein